MKKDLADIIAPPEITIAPNHMKVGTKFARTLFVANYPRYLSTGWLSPIVNAPELMDIRIFMHPVDTADTLKKLKRKTAQIQAQLMDQEEKGLVRNPLLETAYQDVEGLRDSLQQAREHLFMVAIYITLYAETVKDLDILEARVVNMLETRLVYPKRATFEQME